MNLKFTLRFRYATPKHLIFAVFSLNFVFSFILVSIKLRKSEETDMNMYLVKYDKSNLKEEHFQPFFVMHPKEMTQHEFQKQIQLALFDMGSDRSYKFLPNHLKQYGFIPVVTGYFNR